MESCDWGISKDILLAAKESASERRKTMNENIVVDIAREAIFLIIKVAAPILIVSLTVGLIVSILQTVTSIQEQTLTFVPKLIAILLVLILFGNWMLTSIREFMVELYSNFSYYINVI
jgi:flagellar biosynthetic protein FliQ